ncbi:MAG: Uma2 family endonuclease [Saprospiraceae bacterium]|nr:Uma2 family endonuclease [Saprospiraceae bacterium]
MSAETIYRPAPIPEKASKKVTIQTFLRKYRKGGPGTKYEFNKGVIEKTGVVAWRELFIIVNITNHFEGSPSAHKGRMAKDMEVWTSPDQWRKPDLAFISIEQTRAAKQGYEPVPEFVIEVISPNDQINCVKNKVYEYFNAGVKVLWHIFPEQQVVEVYRSPENLVVCSGNKPCSAEPVVEGFVMPAAEVFKPV